MIREIRRGTAGGFGFDGEKEGAYGSYLLGCRMLLVRYIERCCCGVRLGKKEKQYTCGRLGTRGEVVSLVLRNQISAKHDTPTPRHNTVSSATATATTIQIYTPNLLHRQSLSHSLTLSLSPRLFLNEQLCPQAVVQYPGGGVVELCHAECCVKRLGVRNCDGLWSRGDSLRRSIGCWLCRLIEWILRKRLHEGTEFQ